MSQASNLTFFVKETLTIASGTGATFNISDILEFETPTSVELPTATSIVLKNDSQLERMTITATGGVATIVYRGLKNTDTLTEDATLKKQWSDGDNGYITQLAFDNLDKENALPDRITIPTVADTTARDALYPAPTGGEMVEVTSLSAMQRYNAVAAQWETFDIGTPTPFSSPTVAGILETGTTAESKAGTDVGGTGGNNVVLPSDIAANEQSGTFVYAEDAEVSDTYVISLTPSLTAYTTGQKIRFKVNTANTGACTINVDTLGAKNIKLSSGNDPLDNDINTTTIYEAIYDGTDFVLQNVFTPMIGGDASDGSLSVSSGTTTIALTSGYIEKNYSSINITGGTLTVSGPAINGSLSYIKCKGDFTMSAGTFHVNEMGGAGGTGISGDGSSGTGGKTHPLIGVEYANEGTGGTVGSGKGIGGTALSYYVNRYGNIVSNGAGGGSGQGISATGGNGGRGGGILLIEVGGAINITGGTISSNGANGANGGSGGEAGGGGGGGGGSIVLIYSTLTANSGTMQCNGGNGGNGVATASVGNVGNGGGAGGSNGAGGNGGTLGSAPQNGGATSYGNGGTAGTDDVTPAAGGYGGGGGGAGFYKVVRFDNI